MPRSFERLRVRRRRWGRSFGNETLLKCIKYLGGAGPPTPTAWCGGGAATGWAAFFLVEDLGEGRCSDAAVFPRRPAVLDSSEAFLPGLA